MKKNPSEQDMKLLYERLTAQLAQLGYVLPGTITERAITGRADKKQVEGKQYGPYYQWTRKIQGKTQTRNLSQHEVEAYIIAIENNRTLETIIREMRALSQVLLEYETISVKKRKSRRA